MTDAETIAALRAELTIQRKAHNDLFNRLCRMQEELERLERMRGVLGTLCELTREVYDARRAEETSRRT